LKHNGKLGLLTTALVTAGLLAVTSVSAGEYPDKPIKLVVASGAGGSTDTAARIMAINIQDH